MNQILSNLLDNAENYTPAGGKISVAVGLSGRWVEIQVVDTGEGISEEGIGRIFDRFYREDWSRNRSTGGSGLGLAITKQLVEAQNGTIRVESIAGDGSTFRVTFPVNI